MAQQDFLRVGVTGGIGSGKSSVCSIFRELGRVVLGADEIAQTVMEQDPDVRRNIMAAFGADSYLPSGALDKTRMGAVVFGSASSRKRLNAIVHPAVFGALDRAIDDLPSANRHPYLIIEAALIFESGMDKRLDYTVVVHADEETRIERLMLRDHVERPDVLRRMAAQLPAEMKVERGDFIIENNGPVGELRPRVLFIDRLLQTIHHPAS
ncbi:MAG: dephospho-CoA kinase [Ignavibacteria bacterium]|nr:dephospho-CoA kinase [Ignavibacteria bacterium]